MTTMTVPTALSAVGRRRAASLKQVWSQRAGAFLHGLWASLEAYGQRRAAPYLLQQAERLAGSDPALAEELRRLARPASFSFHQPAATASGAR